MRMKFWLKPPRVVYAHCDIPCGIYDPRGAQEAALTVIRMMDLIAESKSNHDTVRYVHTKEEHAERCKHEIRIIWGDYFKDEHLKEFPELHELVHQIMQYGSKARQGADRKIGQELLEKVNQFAEIFWKTKGVKTKRVTSPNKPEEELVYPEL